MRHTITRLVQNISRNTPTKSVSNATDNGTTVRPGNTGDLLNNNTGTLIKSLNIVSYVTRLRGTKLRILSNYSLRTHYGEFRRQAPFNMSFMLFRHLSSEQHGRVRGRAFGDMTAYARVHYQRILRPPLIRSLRGRVYRKRRRFTYVLIRQGILSNNLNLNNRIRHMDINMVSKTNLLRSLRNTYRLHKVVNTQKGGHLSLVIITFVERNICNSGHTLTLNSINTRILINNLLNTSRIRRVILGLRNGTHIRTGNTRHLGLLLTTTTSSNSNNG